MARKQVGVAPAAPQDAATKEYVDLATPGVDVYISTTEPSAAGPLLWVKDLGGNAYSLVIKTP